ncbi:hypothetical protein [Dickeya dadantii]|uniref:Uncharacterized protein n=1 Tax=Dickeya dadantii (strain 3937) TaxID=198628 RepID=E0SJT7_DICD3|nr:hypothetical protein [Dickeya dadantii]ADN00376.1 hypothetical protein Dda3937_00351 [Dickeya dadantii 3937]
MKIRLEHQYIGAAIMQIAEHDQFTAINYIDVNGRKINNAFFINNHCVIFCKYATEHNINGEYVFTFNKDHIEQIEDIKEQKSVEVYICLVCISASEICCLSKNQYDQLINNRRKSKGNDEEKYNILVTAPSGRSLSAYVNAAGKKMEYAGNPIKISRNSFPDIIFK